MILNNIEVTSLAQLEELIVNLPEETKTHLRLIFSEQ